LVYCTKKNLAILTQTVEIAENPYFFLQTPPTPSGRTAKRDEIYLLKSGFRAFIPVTVFSAADKSKIHSASRTREMDAARVTR
jgi:hypothetical protein